MDRQKAQVFNFPVPYIGGYLQVQKPIKPMCPELRQKVEV